MLFFSSHFLLWLKSNFVGTTSNQNTVGTSSTISITTSTSEATTTAGTNIGELCADPNGFYPHPSDCQKYYQCAHGTPYEYTCASGLLWNDQLKYCDWAANVQCNLQPGSSTASSTATGQTVTSPSEVSSPSPVTTTSGYFANISLKLMKIFLNIDVMKITIH